MKFSKSTLITAALAALLGSTSAHAVLQEEMRNYRGVRSVGMGGLITTTGNYSEALFGNPARHSEVDTWKLTILDPTFEVNTHLISSTKDLSDIKGASGSGTISSASKLIGKNEHILFQTMPAYYNPNFIGDTGFAFGFLLAAHTNLLVNYTTDIDTQTIVDAGPSMGLSHKFFDDRLSLGLNLHMIYRVSAYDTLNSVNFLTGSKLSLKNFGNQGIGVDGDIGAYYHLPWELSFMRMALGASIGSVAKTHYNLGTVKVISGAGTSPLNNDRVLNTGVRFDFPDFFIFTAPLLAIELQDIGDTTARVSTMKKTHLGFETKLTRVFSLRAGLNQGYPAAGLGINLPLVKLDFATYGEELTGNAGQLEDRRFILRLALEI